jgi:hypothetical protein
MDTYTHVDALWRTSASQDGTDTSPADLSDLQDHLSLCRQTHGRMHAFHQARHVMGTFFLGHLITSVLVLLLLMGVLSLAL